MTDDIFQIAIRAYLDALAKHDEQFALKYRNPNKSVEECCYYILNQVRETDRIGFDDSEIFGMAVTYYEATELPQEDLKEVKNVRTFVNTKLEKPKTFLMDIHFWNIVDELLNYAKNIDGTYKAEDFTTDNEDVMEMIEQELDDNLSYVWVDEGGYHYPPQDNLRPTAEEICKAIHELF